MFKIKLSLILDYFRACTIRYTSLFIVFYALMNACLAGQSIWLSNWSSKIENGNTDSNKERLIVYAAFGIGQCNSTSNLEFPVA